MKTSNTDLVANRPVARDRQRPAPRKSLDVRIQLARLAAVGFGAGRVAEAAVGEAAVQVRGSHLRLEADRFGEIGDGALEAVLAQVDQAAVVESSRKARLEGDGAIEVGLGMGQVLLVQIGVTAV